MILHKPMLCAPGHSVSGIAPDVMTIIAIKFKLKLTLNSIVCAAKNGAEIKMAFINDRKTIPFKESSRTCYFEGIYFCQILSWSPRITGKL